MMPRLRHLPAEMGFTLLEVMVALAIVSGVLLTVIGSFNYHLTVAGRDAEESEAVLLARGKLEELEMSGNLLGKTEGDFGTDRPGMKWKLDVADTKLPGVRKLTLTVLWNDNKKSLFLDHYI